VVQVFPRLRLSNNADRNEEFYRQQVLLHVPWRSEEGVLGEHGTWREAYEANHVAEHRPASAPLPNPEEDEFEELEEDGEDDIDEWMVAARHMPNQEVEQVELGRRELDLQHDWAAGSQQHGDHGVLTRFLKTSKDSHVFHRAPVVAPQVEFTAEQRVVLDILERQIAAERSPGGTEPPRRVIVQGKAGCGKSTVIQAMTARLEEEFGPGCYRLLAPTAAAAINIKANTIHTGLCIHPMVSLLHNDYQ
jgi:hypothetical protein